MVGLALYCYVLFYPQQRTEFRIFADALQLSLYDVFNILFHLIIVELYGGFHLRLVGCVILEIGYQRYGLIGGCLCCHILGVHHNLGMKNLLVDALVEIVADGTDKHSLRQSGNLTRRNKRIHLRVDRVAHILTVDAHGLPLLENLAEPL